MDQHANPTSPAVDGMTLPALRRPQVAQPDRAELLFTAIAMVSLYRVTVRGQAVQALG
jgi:hypothetical protein